MISLSVPEICCQDWRVARASVMIFLNVGTRMPLQAILAGNRSKMSFFLTSISSSKKEALASACVFWLLVL